jgi:magnesium chelatase subunit D
LKPDFPFSAVVGQDDLKLALVLAAVDPTIGGVLITGERGTAKSTAARGLAALLPKNAAGKAAPFVELPLGATEDRVIGSIDISRVLQDGSTELRSGLLACADGGVLYVDEVNLLPDHIVDLLLDAAASGWVTVERDGISAGEPARFVLIGTMNPEEGELRPQFIDRFGLCVQIRGLAIRDERMAAIRQRLSFDDQPASVLEALQPAEQALREGMAAARERLAALVITDAHLSVVAAISTEHRLDGIRGGPCHHQGGARAGGVGGRAGNPRGAYPARRGTRSSTSNTAQEITGSTTRSGECRAARSTASNGGWRGNARIEPVTGRR